jgi:hypothetical protein
MAALDDPEWLADPHGKARQEAERYIRELKEARGK